MKKIAIILVGFSLMAAGCNPFSKSSVAGLYKTTNSGVDWITINSIAGNTKSTLKGASFTKLAFDKDKHEVIYAASYTSGFFKSEDSGQSWTQILSGFQVFDFVQHPVDANIIYVAGYTNSHGKLLLTKDGGKSWEEIFNEASTLSAVRTVAINSTNPSEVIIGLTHGAVHKSFDGGRNWLALKNFEDKVNKITWDGQKIYLLARSKGFYVSDDSGANFKELSTALTTTTSTLTGLIGNGNGAGIQNYNQFTVNPDNNAEIYLTADNGIYKTTNSGASWARLNVPVKTKGVQFRAVNYVSANPSFLVAAADGTIYKSFDGGITFETKELTASGYPNAVLVDQNNPAIIYIGIYSE